MQEQVEETLVDHLIEESYSSYVNPLALVQRDGKHVRICVDAREGNKFMMPDRTMVPPMQMLLQRFHGATYILTLDLSSAFFTDTFRRILKEMDSFPVSEQGVPIYTCAVWFPKFSQCFY